MIHDNWREKYKNRISESMSPEFSILVKIYDAISKATSIFFDDLKMRHIPIPLITSYSSSPVAPGSDSSPVKIIIGEASLLLTDSAQFYLEYACRSNNEGCYFYGHSFRDEEPDCRHLSQFYHIEAEILGTLGDTEVLVEGFIKFLSDYIWNRLNELLIEVPGVKERISSLLSKEFSFTKISFNEACDFLQGHDNALRKLNNGSVVITSVGEKLLLEKFGDFIWVENWDRMTVPFYQAYDKELGVALNADLLFGIGEVVGAGQRHIGAEELKVALAEHNLLFEDYAWYIEMKRIFPLETAGFGMGTERFLLWLLGLKDIRSVELFPRNRNQVGEL